MRRRQQKIPPPKTRHQALQIFRDALGGGIVERTDHVKKRMEERKVDDADLLAVARSGIPWDGELDIKSGGYCYRVEGRDGDGRTVAVVFEILGPKVIRLITVMRPRRLPK